MRHNSTRHKRGDWSSLLLAALCALMVVAPASGALSMARSLSSARVGTEAARYEAVLRWLHCQAIQNHGALEQNSAILDARGAALLAALCEHKTFDYTHVASVVDSFHSSYGIAPALQSAPVTILPITPLDIAPKPFARIFTSHEAAFLNGIRTNRLAE